jgi:hypothetical protein
VRRRAWDALIWLMSRPAAHRYARLVDNDMARRELANQERLRCEAAEHTTTLVRLRRALGKES